MKGEVPFEEKQGQLLRGITGQNVFPYRRTVLKEGRKRGKVFKEGLAKTRVGFHQGGLRKKGLLTKKGGRSSQKRVRRPEKEPALEEPTGTKKKKERA